MNTSDILSDSEFANSSNFSCVNRTVPSHSIIDIASFMHHLPHYLRHLCSVGVLANGLVIYAVASCKKKMVSDIYVPESGHRRPAFPVGDAVQHPSTGPGQTVGLWPLMCKACGGGGRQ